MKESRLLILASASPQRKELLRSRGIPLRVIPSTFRERLPLTTQSPQRLVCSLAKEKAKNVWQKLTREGWPKDKWDKLVLLAADTLVIHQRTIIGKPASSAEAQAILTRLSGNWHKVYTGFFLWDLLGGKKIIDWEMSRVKMRILSRKEIVKVHSRHLDKAGAYAIQEKNDAFAEKIIGSYSNVVGLPLEKVCNYLTELGFFA